MNDSSCEVCRDDSQFTWRIQQVEQETAAMAKKVDTFYNLMIGTLASSLTTLLGVLVLIIINRGG